MLNLFKMETKDNQLNNFGIASYIAIMVVLIIGALIVNIFNLLDIAIMIAFLHFINKSKYKDGDITIVSILYGIYWLLSLCTGAYVQMFLLPFAYIGMIHMSLHPERAPKFMRSFLGWKED